MVEFGEISRDTVIPNKNRPESHNHSADFDGERSQFLAALGTILRAASLRRSDPRLRREIVLGMLNDHGSPDKFACVP
jgi:hypothetical protein